VEIDGPEKNCFLHLCVESTVKYNLPLIIPNLSNNKEIIN